MALRILGAEAFELPGASDATLLKAGEDDDVEIWQFESTAEGPLLRVAYGDGVDFILSPAGDRIWCTWQAGADLDQAAAYLTGPILAHAARARDLLCLHASVIEVGRQALVLAGASGAGKSTLAAAFADLGHPVLSDDIAAVALEGPLAQVQPGSPRINLWPEAAVALYGRDHRLPPIVSPDAGWDKRYLPLATTGPGPRFHARQLPLGAIYVLGADEGNGRCGIDALSGALAVRALVAQIYPQLIYNRQTLAADFALLGRVAERTPIRRVSAARDLAAVRLLAATIANDFQGLHEWSVP